MRRRPLRRALAPRVLATLTIACATLNAFLWSAFFDFGRAPLTTFDWPKEVASHTMLREAIRSLAVPLHSSARFQETHRFLANPELPLSPQALALGVLDVGTYLMANTALLAVVGTVGTALLASQMRLGALATAFLMLLLGWNGHVVVHLAVGHSMWTGYFFLPWFLWAIFGLLSASDPVRSPRTLRIWAPRLAVSLALAMAQGAFHMTSWLLGTVVLAAIVRPRAAVALMASLVAFVLLSANRIVPALVAFAELRRPANPGFKNAEVLLAALTERLPHTTPNVDGVCWWELDAYLGKVGLAAVVTLALVGYVRGARLDRALLPAAIFFGVFSMGELWVPVANLPIPFANAERGPSRFFLVPLVLACVAAVREGDRLLARTRFPRVATALGVLLFAAVAFDLARHAALWRIPQADEPTWAYEAAHAIVRRDPEYVRALVVGWSLSAVAWAFVLLRAWPRRRRIVAGR